jgi:hypothetical protein
VGVPLADSVLRSDPRAGRTPGGPAGLARSEDEDGLLGTTTSGWHACAGGVRREVERLGLADFPTTEHHVLARVLLCRSRCEACYAFLPIDSDACVSCGFVPRLPIGTYEHASRAPYEDAPKPPLERESLAQVQAAAIRLLRVVRSGRPKVATDEVAELVTPLWRLLAGLNAADAGPPGA